MPAVAMPVTIPLHAAFVPTMRAGDGVPGVALVDQFDRPLSFRTDGRVTIVSFAYTQCPDPAMCALVTTKFARLQRTLSPATFRLVELTLDPVRDRPAVLRRYATAVGAQSRIWLFGTGRPSDLTALAERFGIVRQREGGAIRHTEAVAVLSADGTVQDLVNGNDWSADDVAARAREVAGLSPGPLHFALGLFERAGALCGVHGGGGVSQAAGLALFAGLTLSLGWLALRLFAATFAGRP